MDNHDAKFPEQQAPDKNTDNAFVQVGRDGNPVIPKTADDDSDEKPGNTKAVEQPIKK